ncbi:hypothetical protein FRC11_008812 [Ceratobasidium sp. 423]|nr:hypothetical protein FRC11_008812 [Ceratobasidium sp. 423]
MPLPHAIRKRTSALNKRFDKCMTKLERLEAAERYDEYDALREQDLNAIYKDACDLIRHSDEAGDSYCDELLDTLQGIIDEAGGETGDMYLGPTTENRVSDHDEDLDVVEDQRPQTVRRNELPEPHPRSSPFATFRSNLPVSTVTPADHLAVTVYDARCEISSARDIKERSGGSKEADSVIDMQLSADSSCVAVLGSIKRKSNYRHPWLAYHYPDSTRSKFTDFMSFQNPGRFNIGLSSVPTHMAMDEAQRHILVGDKRRIKSFAWATADGAYYKKPLEKYTMDSTGFAGPILALPNGMIIRAGQGVAAVWDMDNEECEENPTSQVNFANKPKLQPDILKLLPDSPSSVLCTERTHNNCIAIDLEHGGTTIARYKGHHSPVTHVSTSAADPQVFLTSSYNDGYARMFDVRHPQPILALKVKQGGVSCGPIALTHPDGIPSKLFQTTGPEC